jgi:hypothetical protein
LIYPNEGGRHAGKVEREREKRIQPKQGWCVVVVVAAVWCGVKLETRMESNSSSSSSLERVSFFFISELVGG